MRKRKIEEPAGFTLVEVMLVITILGVLAQALVEASQSLGRLTSAGSTLARLQEESDRAQRSILDDLRRSGIWDLEERRYPHIFEGPTPGLEFLEHTYVPGTQMAEDGDSDFGDPHCVVFVLAADLDQDGRPDMDLDRDGTPELDGDGDGIRSELPADVNGLWYPAQNTVDQATGLVWSHDAVSYLVVTGVDGRNRLMRRLNGDSSTDKIIASDVERLDVQTSEETGFQIPTNALRIGVYFRRRDSGGVLFRHAVQFVVGLRNGELML